MKLERLGWSDFFEAQFAPLKGSGLVPARVTAEAGPVYAWRRRRAPRRRRCPGAFSTSPAARADFPATGDWVLARGEGDLLMIERVLDRKSRFSRTAAGGGSDEQVLAANVDTMFVTASLEGGRNFTERGLERYLVMVADGGARAGHRAQQMRPVLRERKGRLHKTGLLNRGWCSGDHAERPYR